MFFDPRIEAPMVRDLTLDELSVRVDRIGSVSAVEDEDDDASSIEQLLMFVEQPSSVWEDDDGRETGEAGGPAVPGRED